MAYNLSNSNKNFTAAERAILTTILYSDIFHFPLTTDELWNYLISPVKVSKASFQKSLKALDVIVQHDGYWSLKKRTSIIAQRKKHLHEVEKKMVLAKKVSRHLASIQSILFIGVSGGLAAGNAKANDDIDLFVIAKKETLFTTRLWITFLLEILGVRRKRLMKNAANTVCVNFIIDETAMKWPKEKHDVYSAREIAQLIPLFERKNTYGVFLKQNSWICTFLPNSIERMSDPTILLGDSPKQLPLISLMTTRSFFEPLMRTLQLAYMNRHRTTEIVTNSSAAFHPRDYRAETLSQLKLKMRVLGLLTNF